MKLDIRRVGPRHHVTNLHKLGVQAPAGAEEFVDHACGGPATNAVVCRHAGSIIGFFRYRVVNGLLIAYGTWVHPQYRNRGIGKRMWRYALTREKGFTSVEVFTISRAGHRLVRSLAKGRRVGGRTLVWNY